MTPKKGSIRLSKKHGVNPMMVQCSLCAGDTNEIALLGHLPGDAEAPRKGVIPGAICDECKKMMAIGVVLVEVRDGTDKANPYRVGRIHCIKREAAERMGITGNAAFIEESVAREIGLPIPQEGGNP
jgi:hypothetical protein